jgi:predicted nucleic acid-binding protein
MSLDRTTSVFFDAASLFAASHSPTGGSAYVVLVCQFGYLQALVSHAILTETERNLLNKSTAEAFSRYRQLIASTPLQLVSAPAESLVRQYEPTFFEDAHVVASALGSQAQYLVTLDQRFVERIRQSNLPIIAISPKEFIQTVLPNHPDYELIRRTII